jgi:transposase-like protein
MKNLLGIIGLLVLLFELYRWLWKSWIYRILEQKKKAKKSRKPAVMQPKSERDCSFCMKEKGMRKSCVPEMAMPWSQRKGRGGAKKRISTEGYFCPNPDCDYYGVEDESIHALVGYGCHGKQEVILDLKCQCCGKKFTSRKNTVLYRLKTHSGMVEKIMWLLALGVDASALAEVFGLQENTIRTWLCRSGMQGRKLHEQFIVELELIQVQLDELWANMKSNGLDMWLWVASDAKTKLVLVLQVGGRTQEMAYSVVHEMKSRLRAGCVPVFSTDRLRHYYYALTAHYGQWEEHGGKKAVWVLLSDFLYGQVIKHQKRRRTVQVERRILNGDGASYHNRLKAAGLSGRINTSFVERLNLSIR